MNEDEKWILNKIERCPECRCACGNDWEYKDFSNKNVIICPQCKTEIYVEDYLEVKKW